MELKEPIAHLGIKYLPGYFDYENLYRRIANEAKHGDYILEIGAWVGKSTVFMAELVEQSIKHDKVLWFTTVDPFIIDCRKDGKGIWQWVEYTDNTPKQHVKDVFYKHIEPFKQYVQVVEGFSVEVSKRYEDESHFAVWIDGDHSYESALADMEAWYPKVRPGGILAGHDFDDHFGVPKAVRHFCKAHSLDFDVDNRSWFLYKK